MSWYPSFERWANEKSPSGVWVYRGQAARFGSIVPKLLRPGQLEHHKNRALFDIDYGVARVLFDSSPSFGSGALHPIISDPEGIRLETIAGMIGSAPSIHPRISFMELIRALAQHYDYPTFFIDVTFHPLVSALFASYSFTTGGYRVSNEQGTLFRWPVRRKSEWRCEMQGQLDGKLITIGVIDIQGIHPLARRPSTQYAALATPVHDPKPIYQPFQTTIEELDYIDIARLDCCERFDLPAGAGEELCERTGARMAGLFPDCIDLGYSYLSLMALLSLTIQRSYMADCDRVLRGDMFKRMISVARAVLDRECYRLDPDVEITSHSRNYSLIDIASVIHLEAETMRRAVHLTRTPKISERVRKQMEKRLEDIQEVATLRFEAWKSAVRNVHGDEAAETLGEPPQYTLKQGDCGWVVGEIDRRLARVEPILKTADWLSLWALEDPKRAEELREVLNSSAEYEATLLGQLRDNRETIEALKRFGL